MAIEIIAEIAQGFEGNPKLAELMALGAVRAGADAVKYQLVYGDELAVPAYPYYDLFKSLEMTPAEWEKVVAIIRKAGKKVYFDVYGDISLAHAKKLGANGVKISTADFYNRALIKKALADFDVVFISVGGVPVEELQEFVEKFSSSKNIAFMYGFQAEPTPTEENNLLKISEYRKQFPSHPIGFMDHSQGDSDEALYLPLMAVSLGVSYIEKHMTLDRCLEIEDFVSALTPERFSQFVTVINKMEPALGQPELRVTPAEMKYKSLAGKVVVAKCDLAAGDQLTEDNLTLKRVSADGSPGCFRRIDLLANKKLTEPVSADSPIKEGMVAS